MMKNHCLAQAISDVGLFGLPEEDQIRLIKEEIFVTTMSSGERSKFLIDNFSKLAYNKDDYVSNFKQTQTKTRKQ